MFLSAAKLGEAGLRRIGAFAINDSAPRPQDMAVALDSLDKLVTELSGTMECFWLLTATLSLPLTANTVEYNLEDALGSDWPGQGIEYVRDCWIEDANGKRHRFELLTRNRFESRRNPEQTGRPLVGHFDRLVPSPNFQPWPIPTDDTWTLRLVIQTLSPTVAGVGPVPKLKAGQSLSAGLPAAWNRWAEYALAFDIGSGPVRTLATEKLTLFAQVAAQSKADLKAFQNQEHDTEPPITASMDIVHGEHHGWPSHHYYRGEEW